MHTQWLLVSLVITYSSQIVSKLQDTLDKFDVGQDYGGGGAVSNQRRTQDFYKGVSMCKKLQEYIGINFDQLLTIQILLIYRSWRGYVAIMLMCIDC